MESHNKTNLATIGDYASVQTCSCCNNEIIHINFYNMTMRLTKECFSSYVKMLNEAMLKIDDSGEFKEALEGIYHFYNFIGSGDEAD